MVRAAVAQYEGIDSLHVVRKAISTCQEKLQGAQPTTGILFANDALDHSTLLNEVLTHYPGLDIVGCCTAGEISSGHGFSDDSLCLMLICADDIEIGAGFGEFTSTAPGKAVENAVAMARKKLRSPEKLCLVFADGIVGNHVDVLHYLHRELDRECSIFGGMSGLQRYHYDEKRTTQFFGQRVLTDSCVILLFGGDIKIAHSLCNSWNPIGQRSIITGTDGSTVTRIGDMSALDFYHYYLGPHTHPAIENPFAVYDQGESLYYLRVPTGYDKRTGAITFPVPLPLGASIQVTETSRERAITDITETLENGLVPAADFNPNIAFVFSCDIRKNILGTCADREIEAIGRIIKTGIPTIGFYTLGEIAPLAPMSRSIVHHCTLVTLLVEAGRMHPQRETTMPAPAGTEESSLRFKSGDSIVEAKRYIDFLERKLHRERYCRESLETNKELNVHLFKMLNQELRITNSELETLNRELQTAREHLEKRVMERTLELARANNELQKEILERERTFNEKETLEAQLHQSNKMEALGTLAGGIAHDFNNLLTPIIGYAEMITRALASSDPNRDNLLQVLKAGKRAKELTRQILLFSRKKKASLQPLELHVIIKEAVKLLRSTIPRTIEIDQQIDEHCGHVLADPSQIHQVLMNLCTNAAHAMEQGGGILTVRLAPVQLTAVQSSQFGDIPPGSYLQLSLADTGRGIEDTVMKRIFEPYFTTKEVGKGTGMGLAVTQAIVKNHNGHIAVHSKPGKGTEFTIFFPFLDKSDDCGIEQEPALDIPGGNEHILFVDDEPMIVQLNLTLLGQLGYRVTAVTSSREALELFTAQPAGYDLIITDQTMPGLTGEALAKRILELRPDAPIILCTGFSAAISEQEAAQIGIRLCLTKPLSTEEMAKAIRKALAKSA